jgi:hypothetical protein
VHAEKSNLGPEKIFLFRFGSKINWLFTTRPVINPAAMNSECGHYYPKVQLRRAGVHNFFPAAKTDWVRRHQGNCTPGVDALFLLRAGASAAFFNLW